MTSAKLQAKLRWEELKPVVVTLAPLALWVMLWLGIVGDSEWVTNRGKSLNGSIRGVIAFFPATAGFIAALVLLARLKHQPRHQYRRYAYLFASPLGLAFVYVLVGVVSLAFSPDKSVALYWTTAYVSVPLVLWALVWGADPVSRLVRIVNFTWLAIALGTVVIFSIGLLYMDLANTIVNPSGFLRCESIGHWANLTSGNLRSTGVGRYAAVTGILAFGALCQGRYRWIWLLMLAGSLALLLTTGARTAMVGFVPALVFMAFLYSVKKTIMVALLSIVALVFINLTTDLYRVFIGECFLKGRPPPEASEVVRSLFGRFDLLLSSLRIVEVPDSRHQGPNGINSQAEDPSVEPGLTTGPGASDFLMLELPTYVRPAPSPAEKQLAKSGLLVKAQRPLERPTNPSSMLSGRANIWQQGWFFIKERPVFGFGFHADRLLMGTQMHNSYLHAAIQTGVVGALPFVGGMVFGWLLVYKVVRNVGKLPAVHKQIVIQMGGLLAFLSVRTLTESTGAFFGVDWILLGIVLIYFSAVNRALPQIEEPEGALTS